MQGIRLYTEALWTRVPVTCRRNSSNISSLSIYQSYGDPGRLTGQHVVGAGALDLTYAYDVDGNIVNYFDGTNQHTFTYDFAGRLQSWTYQGNTVQYDYDAAGNLKNPHGKTLTFNAANEVEGFTYDEAGNLLQDNKYQYEWDGEGHLLTVKDLNGNTMASFTYRPDGLRETKTASGVTYHYHYDGSNLIRITDDNGQTVWAFTWANGKPNTVTNASGDTFYYVTNYRGDVVRIVDENGVTVASYSYDPWGKVLSVSEDTGVAGQPLGYAGYYYDKETKLYYLQARYYDPETARFISRDPDPGDVDDPFTQNGYIYANSNPVMYVDPDGQKRKKTRVEDLGEEWFEYGMDLKNWMIYGSFTGKKKKKSKGKGKSTKNTKTLWDIKTTADKKITYKFHGETVTAYRDPKTGYWWAKDTTGHGDSAFKVFKEAKGGKELHWIADADKYGNFIK
jgi:RHS repeat-associated protein